MGTPSAEEETRIFELVGGLFARKIESRVYNLGAVVHMLSPSNGKT